jgi:hypothetical protein
MKSLILAFVLVFSSSAFARQYIQCSSMDSSTTDVAVMNLTTEEFGTFFISSGMQNDEAERFLMKIVFDKKVNGKHIYKIDSDLATGTVTIDSASVGVVSNSVRVDLSFNGFGVEYSCFSRIYND